MIIGVTTSSNITQQSVAILDNMFGGHKDSVSHMSTVTVLDISSQFVIFKKGLQGLGCLLEESSYIKLFQIVVELYYITGSCITTVTGVDEEIMSELLLEEISHPSIIPYFEGYDMCLDALIISVSKLNIPDLTRILPEDIYSEHSMLFPLDWRYSSNNITISVGEYNRA